MSIFMKLNSECYADRILDACLDTAVGVPDQYLTDSITVEKYNTEHQMELDYVFLACWMYDNRINFDKEIDKYCKKHNTHRRHASYELLSAYLDQWRKIT